jgi:hypothetical protein
MNWKELIIKERPSYNGYKSKFWGDSYNIPNELGYIANRISKMGEEEKNNPEVQKDIKYIKELVAHQMKLLQKYLELIE